MTTRDKHNYNALPGVNWGTSVIDAEDIIDPTKEYRTSTGKRVLALHIVLRNSCGEEVTFPVKGSVVMCEKPLSIKYTIWTLDGRHSLFCGQDNLNLVEFTPNPKTQTRS